MKKTKKAAAKRTKKTPLHLWMRRKRLSCGYTLDELGQKLGAKAQMVSNVEGGFKMMPSNWISTLAQEFKTSFLRLLDQYFEEEVRYRKARLLEALDHQKQNKRLRKLASKRR